MRSLPSAELTLLLLPFRQPKKKSKCYRSQLTLATTAGPSSWCIAPWQSGHGYHHLSEVHRQTKAFHYSRCRRPQISHSPRCHFDDCATLQKHHATLAQGSPLAPLAPLAPFYITIITGFDLQWR